MTGGHKLIGLVGGVGPWAGLDVHRKILEESAYVQEQDCVSVMHLSFPGKYTDRTDYLLGRNSINPAHAFIRELQFLEASGANSAAIVCNTAHADPIMNVISGGMNGSALAYVSIIRETQQALELDGIRRAGLLATLGTYALGLYQDGFSGEIVHPGKNDRQRVHDIIYNPDTGLKANYPLYAEELCEALAAVARKLIAQGAEALVLGCTELPLLQEFPRYVDVPVYDPNRILAKALIKNAFHAQTPPGVALHHHV